MTLHDIPWVMIRDSQYDARSSFLRNLTRIGYPMELSIIWFMDYTLPLAVPWDVPWDVLCG